MSTTDRVNSRHLLTNTLKQLQFVVFGAAVSWYLDTFARVQTILGANDVSSLPWISLLVALCASAVTVLSFFYVLVYLPRIRRIRVNYQKWRENDLRLVVPIMTASILLGWNAFLLVFWRYSSLGLLWGSLADLGLHTLSFGILGLIPRSSLVEPIKEL